ncbi:TPA: MTAP family purine nucleoside phosphorylase, partial [Candidatus Woesearchaeota archaeon]|nr:MTAP family purine nucleoside phosphorylase [Candidatus Woesearchaeota archaeon]
MKIAIIGGSGFENPSFAELQERTVQTPYGTVIVKEGVYDDIPIVLLSRHGKDHTLTPSKVNYRANMYALKESNVTHILATTACGSLRENIQRGDLVIVDQFIDFTRHRHITFHDSFEPGNAVHT